MVSALLGCRPAPSPAPVKPVADGAAEASPASDHDATSADVPNSQSADAAAPSPNDSSPPEPAEQVGTASNDNPPPDVEPYRLLVLTRDRPLIVHVRIDVDGQPQTLAVERRLDAAFEAAASTDDPAGDPSWDKLLADSRFASGQFGNMPLADAAARNRAIQQFDTNRDQRAQSDELAAFLAQDAARGRPFSVRWIARRESTGPVASPLHALLDTDDDGLLSGEEMAAASTRLCSRDVNDDDALALADVLPPPVAGRSQRYRREAPRSHVFELRDVDFESAYYALGDLYGSNAGLRATLSDRFAALDQDADGWIDGSELAGLLEAPPDVSLRVAFPAASGDRARPAITIQGTPDHPVADDVTVSLDQDDLIVALRGSRIEFVAVDRRAADETAAAAQDLFAELDADDSGTVDEAELAAAGETPQVEALRTFWKQRADADDDGQWTLAELQSALQRRRPYRQLQVEVSAASGDHLFHHLDSHADGRLTSREISGAAARLAELDRDGDDHVAPGEIPQWIRCVIACGAVEGQSSMSDYLPSRAPLRGAEAPPWHTAMDRNGDSEVSRREFLGTPDQFRELDTSGDGFVDAQEAAQATPDEPSRAEKVPPEDAQPESSPDDDSPQTGAAL